MLPIEIELLRANALITPRIESICKKRDANMWRGMRSALSNRSGSGTRKTRIQLFYNNERIIYGKTTEYLSLT